MKYWLRIIRKLGLLWSILSSYILCDREDHEIKIKIAQLLSKAADDGHQEVTEFLKKPLLAKELPSKALMMASQEGHDEVVALLLANGADVNKQRNDGVTPLMLASQNDHDKVVALLLANGADVNKQRHDGVTSLMLASQYGYDKVVALLLENGAYADVDKPTHDGFTSLMLASQNGHDKVVALLLAKEGADFNKQRNDGVTSLMLAASGGKEKVVKLLLANKADVSTREDKGRNAMFFAKDNVKVKDILQNRLSQCLNSAAKQGDVALLEKLIASGANINSSNALLFASSSNKYSCVAKLLESKANVDKCSKDKSTSLMYAVKSGSKEIVTLLLKNGAKSDIKNSHEKQAIDYATSKEIKELLSQEASVPTNDSPNSNEVKCSR